jgi:3-oxoadipate enol-lactonase
MPAIELRDGVSLHYLEAGEGTPLVLLHGVGSVARTWDAQLAELSDRWRCIAVDLRGSGESRAPAPSISIDAFAADAAELVRALDGPAHVCGLSLGGVVALRLAATEPEAVRSLVIADSWAYHPAAAAALPERLRVIDATDMDELARQRMPAVYGPAAPPALVERGIAAMAAKDRACYRRSNEVLWGTDLREEALRIRAPALVLVGERDTVTPPPLSEELASLLPDARYALIPDAGHLSNEENPAAFNVAVREFLAATERAI